MKPDQIDLFRWPGRPRLSPDGTQIAVAVRRMDLKRNHYLGDVWLLDASGKCPPRQLTAGCLDSQPQWSPDGRRLSFLRAVPGSSGPAKSPQLHLMATGGGEPFPVTRNPLGVAKFVWHPAGRRVAYLARVPEEGRYGTVPGIPPRMEPPRRVRHLLYRRTGIGYTFDQRMHVFTVQIPAESGPPIPTPVQLTGGDFDHFYLAYSPKGDKLAFVTARHEDRETWLTRDVFVQADGGNSPTRVTDGSLRVSRPAFSLDGESVYFLGYEVGGTGRDVYGRHSALWSVPLEGSSPPTRVSGPEIALAGGPGFAPEEDVEQDILVTADGVLVERPLRGAVQLISIRDQSTVQELLTGPRQVLGFDARPSVLALTVASDTSSGEVLVKHGSSEQRLSTFGQALSAATDVHSMHELSAHAPDGYPLHGWTVYPSGDGPHPVLLFIHGGPFVQSGWDLFDEVQVYAGAGYAVVLSNERGSCGYGEAHSRAAVQNFGKVGAMDLHALLDAALEDPRLDSARVGVLGGSYGGFMTSWLVSHSPRFQAAVSERSVNAWDSMVGTGNVGTSYPETYIGTSPDELRALSPLTFADRITTPLMLVHSEEDWNCPLEQAQRLYVALKQRGANVELLIFPGEGHELTRSGLPSHRQARFEAILDWFDRWLK